jgi:hypothetical protein
MVSMLCEAFTGDRSPPSGDGGSSFHGVDSLQSLSLPPGRPTPVGPTPLRSLPSQRHHPDEPRMGRDVPRPPWFRSQAFSASQRFPGRSELAALSHAAAIREAIPPELSPREDRAPLSGPPTPLQSSARGWNAMLATLSPTVSTDSCTLTGTLAGSPANYGLPFEGHRGLTSTETASRSPWVTDTGLVRPASFTCFEASFPSRVRSRHFEFPLSDGRYSPGLSAPLKPSPPTPRTLDPPGPKAERAHCPRAARTALGSSHPPQSGEDSTAPKREAGLVGVTRSCVGRHAPPVGSVPSPLAFLAVGEPTTPGLRSIKVRGKRRVSAEIACSSGVSCLLDDLAAAKPLAVLAYRFAG